MEHIKFPENFKLKSVSRVKFGIDPTSDKLHLGHLIPLLLVSELKEAGHKIDIILGTFTARLGDPSGKDKMRPMLSPEDTDKNAKSIVDQVHRILGKDISIHFNGDWLSEMSMVEVINTISKFTVGNLLSRDSFQKRMENSNPIGLHELIVPILQGLDSVHLNSDIEIGGTDQLFNFKITRELQVLSGQDPENCFLIPIINGIDGRKMSKSFDNCIFINDNPIDVFGKTMSIDDNTMEQWCEIFNKDSQLTHPFEKKKELAFNITKIIWDVDSAKNAQKHFEEVIQKKNVPLEMKEVNERSLIELIKNTRNLSLTKTRSLLEQNAIRVNNVVVNCDTTLENGDIVKIGKRDFVKII